MFSLKKAQGALEFLMTYGWAFLVILIMIGALAYFGVLSPNKFLPERCNFGSQFLCKDYQMTPTEVTLRLQNNLGQAAYILDTAATTITSPEGFTCSVTIYDSDGTTDVGDSGGTTPDGTPISDGGYFIVKGTGCSGGGIVEGSKYKVNVDLSYFASTSSVEFSHTIQGELFSNVEAS